MRELGVLPNPLPSGPFRGDPEMLIRPYQAKPTPGFEPGTPSLRVKCSGQLSYVGAEAPSIGTASRYPTAGASSGSRGPKSRS
jgi:hypothetical protein